MMVLVPPGRPREAASGELWLKLSGLTLVGSVSDVAARCLAMTVIVSLALCLSKTLVDLI